jgi:hypothetical protein
VTLRPIPAAADLYGDLLDIAPSARIPLGRYLPGIAITTIASLAAAYLSEHYGAPLMLMGLLIGLAFNFANADEGCMRDCLAKRGRVRRN